MMRSNIVFARTANQRGFARGMLLRFAGTMLAALGLSTAVFADAFRYSDEPLKQKPLMTTAEMAVDVAQYNNWLGENHASIPKDKIAVIREHAYVLIDSILRGQRAENRSVFNDSEKFAL